MEELFIYPIKWYQQYISPYLPASCRYHPSCSNYMITAIHKHGVAKGLLMGSARIIRCNPWVKGGIDYVPDFFTLKRNPLSLEEQLEKYSENIESSE